jgi:tRNA threonylcarbamoyl adenosine modification protein YjeE
VADAEVIHRGSLDLDGLRELAGRVAGMLRPGDRVFLVGDLGTGKSTFVRAVLRELGVEGDIPSPSFVMDAVYETCLGETHHVDLYRLSGDARELEALGLADVLDSGGLVLVEWADRLPPEVFRRGWRVDLDMTDGSDERTVTVERRSLAGD